MTDTMVLPQVKQDPVSEAAVATKDAVENIYKNVILNTPVIGKVLKTITEFVGKNRLDQMIPLEEKGSKKKKWVKDQQRGSAEWLKWFKKDYADRKTEKKDRTHFYKNLWKSLKGLGKSLHGLLKAAYGNWFTNLLKFLLFLAFFDPKGTFLNSIIDFLLKMVINLLNILLPMLPKIIKILINIITVVLPTILNKIVTTIFGFISQKLAQLSKATKNPTLKWIFKKLSELFAPDGILTKLITKIIPILVPLIIIIGLIVKMMPVLSVLGSIISFLIANPVVLAIIAIIAAMIAFVKYGDKIVKWLSDMFGPGSPLVSIAKGLQSIFVGIWGFIKNIIGAVIQLIADVKTMSIGKAVILFVGRILLSLGKLFISLLFGALNIIWGIIKAFFIGIPKLIWKLLKGLGSVISDFFPELWYNIKVFFAMLGSKIGNFFSGIWKSITNWASDIWKNISKKGTSIFDSIKDAWNWIVGKVLGFGKKVIKGIINFYKWYFGLFKRFGLFLFDIVAAPFRNIKNTFGNIFEKLQPVFELLNKVLTPIKTVLGEIWDLIKGVILKAFNGIKTAFMAITDIFAMFSDLSSSDIAFSSDAKAGYLTMRKTVREQGGDMGKIEKALKGEISKEELDPTNRALFDMFKQLRGSTYKEKIGNFSKWKTQDIQQQITSVKIAKTDNMNKDSRKL